LNHSIKNPRNKPSEGANNVFVFFSREYLHHFILLT
jgi:hypothetical protein